MSLLNEHLKDIKRKRSKATYNAYRSVLSAFFPKHDVSSFNVDDINGF